MGATAGSMNPLVGVTANLPCQGKNLLLDMQDALQR